MELTSKAINEAEFSMARKGYDPDQVDEFLEKLAVAVDKQGAALAEARERAAAAERRAAEVERRSADQPERSVEPAGPSGPSPEMSAAAEAELETLKRTLLLAQKTADAAIREAEEEARRMISTAEADARAAEDGARAQVLAELATLEDDRTSLRTEVTALEKHLDEHRGRLRASIGDLQRILDDPARLKAGPAAAAPSRPAAPKAGASPSPSPGPAPKAPPQAAAPAAAAAASASSGPFTSDLAARDSAPAADDDAWARFGNGGGAVDPGPPTEQVIRLDVAEQDGSADDEDAYLAELRKAMLDDTGAPGLDDDLRDDLGSRSRFGRRR